MGTALSSFTQLIKIVQNVLNHLACFYFVVTEQISTKNRDGVMNFSQTTFSISLFQLSKSQEIVK